MSRLPLVLALCSIASLLVSLSAAESATFREARLAAIEEAQQDIAAGTAVILSYGMPISPVNLDQESGLPIRAIAGCIVDDGILGRAQGYNETVRSHRAEHGEIAGNHLAWSQRITDPAAHLDPEPMLLAAEHVQSPDGIWKLTVAEDELRVVSATDEPGMLLTRLGQGRRVELHWGPTGSDLLTVAAVADDGVTALQVIDLRRELTLNQTTIRRATE